jgi:hypothetical protein
MSPKLFDKQQQMPLKTQPGMQFTASEPTMRLLALALTLGFQI